MLFDENGMFCLDERIAAQSSFRKIMEDNRVTDEELAAQAELVISLLQRIEKSFTPDQLAEVEELLTEMGVLYAIHHHKEMQELHH